MRNEETETTIFEINKLTTYCTTLTYFKTHSREFKKKTIFNKSEYQISKWCRWVTEIRSGLGNGTNRYIIAHKLGSAFSLWHTLVPSCSQLGPTLFFTPGKMVCLSHALSSFWQAAAGKRRDRCSPARSSDQPVHSLPVTAVGSVGGAFLLPPCLFRSHRALLFPLPSRGSETYNYL